ncbi:cholestenol delta-isomerase [Malassezia pachydermatis]
MPLLSVQLQQTILSIGYVGLLICTSFYLLSFTRQRGLRIGQKATFFWLVFDALIHFFLEGPFVYYSTGGRTVNTSTGFFATVWKEYSHADARWGVADPNIVAVEILTVVLTGLLAMYAAWLVLHNRPQYHFWICFLCIAELYGDYVCVDAFLTQMTFVPEILAGSPVRFVIH